MPLDPSQIPEQPSDSDSVDESANLEAADSRVRRSPWQWLAQPMQTVAQVLEPASRWATQWFQVDEAELQQVLEQIRLSLPTTEVILIGKAQTGKSSIIRALTGSSAEIVGQGFRPHTAHTQRYAYPTEDLSLLTFIDTVGLGEGFTDPTVVTTELQALLRPQEAPETPQAQILVATLKVTDFATDAVHRLLMDLRRAHPHIPCLLAITCLHEVYPASITDHPDYPPSLAEVQRAAQAIQSQFKDVCDRTVLIDFTLEEDGYTPVLYGFDAFIENLAELLPQAEANVIRQLLVQGGLSDRIGTMYRDAGRRYILPFSVMAATVAAVPLPFTMMPVLTAVQVSMVMLLGRLYGQTISPAQAGGIASAIAGGFAAQLIGRELVKFIPGFGAAIAASWAAAYTWALGEGACVYFGDLMGGKTPDPQRIRQAMQEGFKSAQERLKDSVTGRTL